MALALLSGVGHAAPPDLVPPGYRPIPPGIHALVGARVVVKPDETLTNATIIVRDGLIERVGKSVTPPADARVWDLTGMTVYAGFIDPHLTAAAAPRTPTAGGRGGGAPVNDLTAGTVKFFGVSSQDREAEGPGYEVARVTPERQMARSYVPDSKANEKLREIGFTAANVTPERGIVRGVSALVALSDEEPNATVIRPEVFQHVAFEIGGGRGGGYPGSLMGMVAVVRQSFLDAEHYKLDQDDYRKHDGQRPRPAYNPGLEALEPALAKKMRVIFEPRTALMVDRATRVAHELNLEFGIVATGQEWRRPELAKAAGAPFIVPLNFPSAPRLPQDDDWQQVTLDELRVWDWAAENPAVLRHQGLEIALTTTGLADKSVFRKNLRLALDRGLSEKDALAALTTVPARLCGVERQMGTIEAGKQANLTIVDGKGYFDPESKVRAVWIDGRYYRIAASEPKEETKDGTGRGGGRGGRGGNRGGATEPANSTNVTVTATATNSVPAGTNKLETLAGKQPEGTNDQHTGAPEGRGGKSKEAQKRIAQSPLTGRGVLTNPPALLIRNATIWTESAAGRLTNADLYVRDGKIQKIGRNLYPMGGAPDNTLVMDGTGLQITPGIIDCHSHSMILGGVNEGTLPSSAMVRVGDVVNSDTANIYAQLASGVTAVNLLHGSANPIGGQNCVIKLRDGESPEGLKFKDAPQGIKFALGENVKQSNFGDRTASRFPQTRMGVQTFFNERFVAAQQYLQAWTEYRKSGGVPPRRDLEMEALGEILEGKRLIHCHSYRQDEIVMLIRLMEQFGVKIASFQHVLEGYKVADEIARHGAGGSTFSDWWAYKWEVYDAIPYNGSLMRSRGVVVSFNSDSDDLARRLYQEAAKAVKYGGTPEEEALKFVTLNPAKQLHIDQRVGSLEPGKDADFAVWSGSPLDSFTVCRQTWIEGREYFDIALAPARAAALARERSELLVKVKKAGGPGGPGGGDAANNSFFEVSLEHQYDGTIRHCLDNE